MKAHMNDITALRYRQGRDEWECSWANSEPARDNYRRCWYCGSLHPEDLLKVLKEGARINMADWKYGYPHKFYIEGVPNLLAGQTVRIGSRSGPLHSYDGTLNVENPTEEEIKTGRYDRPTMGAAPPHAVIKFYTEHLIDAGDAFTELTKIIYDQTKVFFSLDDDRIMYRRVK